MSVVLPREPTTPTGGTRSTRLRPGGLDEAPQDPTWAHPGRTTETSDGRKRETVQDPRERPEPLVTLPRIVGYRWHLDDGGDDNALLRETRKKKGIKTKKVEDYDKNLQTKE